MNAKKKKHTVRIIPPHSEHYIYINDNSSEFHANTKQDAPKKKEVDRKSIKDLKKMNRYKSNSKNTQSRQNHSPVYE
ncbi:hypothetical protein [Nitrosopumilus sp.]|uniref:hypothetical protein n=1 Tax=Nitrosopumilus sp. TaxID=2024843 RepID=UPI0034A09EC6